MQVDRSEGKVLEEINVSKHVVKKVTYNKVKKIVKEIRTGNTECKEGKEEN